MERENPKKGNEVPAVLKAGAVSLAFLIIGYQVALFIHRVSVERIESLRDRPDTVYVIDPALAERLLTESAPPRLETGGRAGTSDSGAVTVRKNAGHSSLSVKVREAGRKVESFRFNPNTVSVSDLERLGFTAGQAQAIDNYRASGGRFRRKSDFAKSFVVSDSVFRRLEKYIDIPLVDINAADSAAFDALPGIGGYFAARMVSYREELGGYSYPEQLMDIWHFDRERYDALADLICCSAPKDTFALWSLPAEELRKHPYIRTWQTARSVVLYRDNTPRSDWTVDGLARAGIIADETAGKLARCAIRKP